MTKTIMFNLWKKDSNKELTCFKASELFELICRNSQIYEAHSIQLPKLLHLDFNKRLWQLFFTVILI